MMMIIMTMMMMMSIIKMMNMMMKKIIMRMTHLQGRHMLKEERKINLEKLPTEDKVLAEDNINLMQKNTRKEFHF
jgi:hypothetical protein